MADCETDRSCRGEDGLNELSFEPLLPLVSFSRGSYGLNFVPGPGAFSAASNLVAVVKPGGEIIISVAEGAGGLIIITSQEFALKLSLISLLPASPIMNLISIRQYTSPWLVTGK